MTSYADEYTTIKARFAAQMAVLRPTVVLYYARVGQPENADSGTTWARFTLLNALTKKVSIGRTGDSVFRHKGLVDVSVFIPINEDENTARAIGDDVCSIFRDWSSLGSGTGIHFGGVDDLEGGPQLRVLPPEGDIWHHIKVDARFFRDTLF